MSSNQRPPKRRSLRLEHASDGLEKGAKDVDFPQAKRARRDDGRVASSREVGGLPMGKPAQKATYDEEDDDGFTFTRTRAKKPKVLADPPAPAPESRRVETTTSRRKKSFSTPIATEKQAPVPPKRSTRNSGGETREDHPRRTEATTSRAKPPDDEGDSVVLVAQDSEPHRTRKEVVKESTRDAAKESTRDTTKIALPFSDTPIIKRNKEFRQHGSASRRSSLGLRGRRASSLIDSGSSALPHGEVQVADFYRHIAGDTFPEPRRMKQLLTWCGTRALGEKPLYSSEDGNARLAARVIQEELLRDFSNRSEMSDWFSREDTAPAVVVKKPNPRNVANVAKIQELEKQLQRLQEENDAWQDLLKPNTTPSQPPPMMPASSTNSEPASLGPIDTTLLSTEQQAILSGLQGLPRLYSETSSHLHALSSSLEFRVDRFADGVHHLNQYQHSAERLAERILGSAATRLHLRDQGRKEKAGTRDLPTQEVLRALAAAESKK
ncbi:MAG: hypothetical protein M1838_004948 [Thelocarpon superellum]|nr:MAG: hypothetical protein M1838_004948 [Thelocarpon superellum]